MKRRSIVFTTAVLILALVLLCGAGPDLSGLSGSFVLAENRSLLTGPSGETLLLSTNNNLNSKNKTLVAAMLSLEGAGVSDGPALSSAMSYRRALVDGGTIYLLGLKYYDGTSRVALSAISGDTIAYSILSNVDCDFNRRFEVRGGEVYMVTAPFGEEITDSTPVSVYRCDFGSPPNEAVLLRTEPQFPPEPESSQPESSQPSPSSTPASSGEYLPPAWESGDYYEFAKGLTCADLQAQFDGFNQSGAVVRVTSPEGSPVMRGRVYTGCTVEVYQGAERMSRVVAVVPGDLGGTAGSTERLLCEKLAGAAELNEAQRLALDLDGDGGLTAADLVLLKRLNANKDE